jgi:hypothetical protein
VAVRKETIKQQFNEALPAVLESRERGSAAWTASRGRTLCGRRACSGSPGSMIFGMRYYDVALTDRRLIFMNASF